MFSGEYRPTISSNGPVLPHDHYLIQQRAALDHEIIADRQSRAKGGTFGRFDLAHGVSRYMSADLL
ncbi:catalase [Acetobacter sacchari]|uniref:Catalase n=2 Tax=Acetobacter sacchari TaxID=2661687 RepID=A0ABS3LX04_9PROT|nr:catalase [Acetobacter sacchari]